jgi:hypothetical protein
LLKIIAYESQFQNSVNFGTGFRKSGLKPAFSSKIKVAVPKTEALEQPQIKENNYEG